MSDTEILDPAAAPATDNLFVEPTAADQKARTAAPEVPAIPADPKAPFGYMVDPVTGETRPKKAPGRGSGKPKDAAAPPAKRSANRPRTAPVIGQAGPVAVKVDTRTTGQKVAELADGLWMLTASAPAGKGKMFGIDLEALAVKAKAQGWLIQQHKPGLVQGVSLMAQQSDWIKRGVDALTTGNVGTVLPAMFAVLPFVMASSALWKGNADAARPLAAESDAQFAKLAAQMQAQPQDQAAADGAPVLTLVPNNG